MLSCFLVSTAPMRVNPNISIHNIIIMIIIIKIDILYVDMYVTLNAIFWLTAMSCCPVLLFSARRRCATTRIIAVRTWKQNSLMYMSKANFTYNASLVAAGHPSRDVLSGFDVLLSCFLVNTAPMRYYTNHRSQNVRTELAHVHEQSEFTYNASLVAAGHP